MDSPSDQTDFNFSACQTDIERLKYVSATVQKKGLTAEQESVIPKAFALINRERPATDKELCYKRLLEKVQLTSRGNAMVVLTALALDNASILRLRDSSRKLPGLLCKRGEELDCEEFQLLARRYFRWSPPADDIPAPTPSATTRVAVPQTPRKRGWHFRLAFNC
jgi:hypothetical protein